MKENYMNDVSTITKTDSINSLISYEESFNKFNETCKIVGLDMVKATHEKSYDNVECCSILEEETFEIELKIIQILKKLSFAISTTIRKTKKDIKDKYGTEQDEPLTKFTSIEIDSTPSLVSINSYLSKEDIPNKKNNKEEQSKGTNQDHYDQNTLTMIKNYVFSNHTYDTKHIRVENRNNTCHEIIRIMFIVMFAFASLHMMHHDRITLLSSGKDFFSGKQSIYNSNTNQLRKDDIILSSVMKDTVNELDNSFYSVHEFFLLV